MWKSCFRWFLGGFKKWEIAKNVAVLYDYLLL